MESNFNLNPVLSVKVLDNNPMCKIHQSPVIAVCIQQTCLSKGGICINCLLSEHFKDHEQINIIPIKEYLEKLDDFFMNQYKSDDIAELLDTKTLFLDVLENFKNTTQELIETMKSKIDEQFSYYESLSKNNMTLPDMICSEILKKEENEKSNSVSKLLAYSTNIGINFSSKERTFNKSSNDFNKKKILDALGIDLFLTELENLSKNMKKKLTFPSSNYYFNSFNITDNSVVSITKTPSGMLFKKVLEAVNSTYLIISNEVLDFSKTITWRIQPMNLPSRWMGIGVLPKDKFKREVWNSTDFIGFNCDGYFLDRGSNNSNDYWKVTTESLVTFNFDGPVKTLKIEKTNPQCEYISKNLDPKGEWCLALFFHYPGSEILLY